MSNKKGKQGDVIERNRIVNKPKFRFTAYQGVRPTFIENSNSVLLKLQFCFYVCKRKEEEDKN